MAHARGERVGVWLDADDKQVRLLGYGVYVGDEVTPKPMGMMAALFDNAPSWEVAEAHARAEGSWEGPSPMPRNVNAKIVLDNGKVVWGCECWWGIEETMRKKIAGRIVVEVDIDEARRAQEIAAVVS